MAPPKIRQLPRGGHFRMTLGGDWAKARSAFGAEKLLARAVSNSVYREALRARGMIVKGISDQAPAGKQFKKLSALTLAIRRMQGFTGTKALIRSGFLRRSVQVRRVGFGRYDVGVSRGATYPGGQSVLNVARIQEHGAIYAVRVTPAMRRFLWAAIARMRADGGGGDESRDSAGGPPGIMIVKIPARPFIRPVMEALRSDPGVAERLAASISVDTGRLFG